jgi:hypothetical protein
MLTITEVDKSSIITGIMNVIAVMNLNRNVETVDSQISFSLCLFSASSEIWMPSASEKASAIAMVRIPPITASFEFVPEVKPTIKPRVVIIPEVNPKLNPVLIESLIKTVLYSI